MKGESDLLLSYLPSLLQLSGLSKITVTPRFTILEQEDKKEEYEYEGRLKFDLNCSYLGRLNLYMRQYMVDGQYRSATEEHGKLLDKHNLHILYS